MSDLQNRLDKHGIGGLDKEALWQRIERPKKSYRLAAWWWLGGVFLCFCLVGVYYIQEQIIKSQSIETITVIPEDPINTKDPQYSNNTFNSAANLIDPLDGQPDAKQTHTSLTTESEKEYVASGLDNSTHEISNNIVASVSNVDTTHVVLSSDVMNAESFSTPVKKNREIGIIDAESVDTLSKLPLPLRMIVLGDQEYDFSSRTVSQEKQKNGIIARHKLEILGGAVLQRHIFSGEGVSARQQESTSIGQYLGLKYKHQPNEKYYLLGELRYAIHHSNIKTTNISSQQFLNAIGTITLVETRTAYQLYNEYHRLDVGVGMGKAWTLKSWQLTTELSLGRAQWMRIEGDYLNDSGALQVLGAAADISPSFYGQLSVGLNRMISKNSYIGMHITAQSPIDLTTTNEVGTHGIIPFYGGLSGGIRF
jgi:hypothetical protein